MDYIFDILPSLLKGLETTLIIFFFTLIIALPLGVFVSIGRLSKIGIINRIFQLYITLMRGTPLLLQIVFIYYGLPTVGIVFDRLIAVLIAFILNYAAYFGEILRGGIQSIDRGQNEASIVIGISKWNNFRFIILPQVIKRSITSVSNEIITLVKDTSLVSIVGMGEVLRAANIASNRDATLLPFLLAGIIYLVVTALVAHALMLIERRYKYYE